MKMKKERRKQDEEIEGKKLIIECSLLDVVV